MALPQPLEVLEGLTPDTIGLDLAQFPSFRPEQLQAAEQVVYGEERVQGLVLPGGAGKSLAAWLIAQLQPEAKTLILTHDLGLMAQYDRDFSRYGLIDIKGRSNYECETWGDCGEARGNSCPDYCTGKELGELMGRRAVGSTELPSCPYQARKIEATEAQVKLSNYKYWLYANARPLGGLGRVDCLIMDEAHFLQSEILSFMQVQLWESQIKKLLHDVSRPTNENIGEWRQWAGLNLASVKAEMLAWAERLGLMKKQRGQQLTKEIHQVTQQIKKLGPVVELLEKLDAVVDDSWICEEHTGKYGRYWTFDPLTSGRYLESRVLKSIPKVVPMSATLNHEIMKQTGFKKEEYRLTEWPRIFPANRNPIYLIPPRRESGAGVKLSKHSSDADYAMVIELMDQIIDGRLDRKGLIQSVSYDRQQRIMDGSRHSALMIGNTRDPESDDAREAAKRFRRSSPPTLLVSPSFATGWSFKGRECEYIILIKFPFKPVGTKVEKRRCEIFPRKRNQDAVLEFAQSSWRGMRAGKDRCEVFVVDAMAGVLYTCKDLAPRGYVDSIQQVKSIPKAPERVAEII